MDNNINHTDPFFNSLKDSFQEWEADFSVEELNLDWGSIKPKVVKTPQVRFTSPRNIMFSAVGVVAIVTGVILYPYLNKSNKDIIKPIKENTEYVTPDKNNTSGLINSDNATIKPEHRSVENKSEDISNLTPGSETLSSDEVLDNNEVVVIAKESDNKNTQITGNDPQLKDNKASSKDKDSDKDVESHNSYYGSLVPEIVDMGFPTEIIFSSSRKPKKNEIVVSDTVICVDETLKIDNVASSPQERIDIGIGDQYYGNVNGDINHNFTKAGDYQINLTHTEKNIKKSTNFTVHVEDKPVAKFSYDASETPVIGFENQSRGAIRFVWNFGDYKTSNSQNPKHSYFDTGDFDVTLIGLSQLGCSDTFIKQIHVVVFPEVTIPNIITPNGDGANDRLEIELSGEKYFKLEIFDRNGNNVFSTTNINNAWDGKYKNTDNICSSGTYYYIFSCQFIGYDKPLKKRGIIKINK